MFKARQAIVLLLCLGTLRYFAGQALKPRYSLETRAKLLARSVALGEEFARLEAVRESLERDTGRLAADPPDLDLLEEHARSKLGLLRPDDRRVQLPPL